MQKHTCQVEQTQIFGFAKILMEVLSSLASALHPDLCPHLHAACITSLTPQEGSGWHFRFLSLSLPLLSPRQTVRAAPREHREGPDAS